MHPLLSHPFTPSYLQHAVCILYHTPSTMQTHPAPCPPPTLSYHRLHTMHQSALEQSCSIRQKCIRRRSQALGGLGRRGCYLGQQPIAAHPRLYPLSMQHATLSSSHIQTSAASLTEKNTILFMNTAINFKLLWECRLEVLGKKSHPVWFLCCMI